MTDRTAARAPANPAAPDGEAEPYDAGNERHVKEREGKSKQREAQRLNGLKALMATAEGRAWMWSLLDFAGPFRTGWVPDSDRTIFNEGMRNVGNWALGQVRRHCLAEYALMEKEANG